jgi:hypothetical protein
MALDDAVKIKNTEIASHLNLPPVKLHCSMLAEDAIKAAVPYALSISITYTRRHSRHCPICKSPATNPLTLPPCPPEQVKDYKKKQEQ